MRCSCALLIRFHFDEISHSYSSLAPKEMVLFHFFLNIPYSFSFARLFFVFLGHWPGSAPQAAEAGQRQELRVGRRWEQSPTLMATSAQNSSSRAGDFTLRCSFIVCFLILLLLVVCPTWGVRSVPESLLGFVSFSLYFTRTRPEGADLALKSPRQIDQHLFQKSKSPI